jgi:hypothetical protein
MGSSVSTPAAAAENLGGAALPGAIRRTKANGLGPEGDGPRPL